MTEAYGAYIGLQRGQQPVPARHIVCLYSSSPQSGKSEIAQRLQARHDFRLVKLAGPLKAMLKAMYEEMGLDPRTIEDMIEGSAKEELVPGMEFTTRSAMQTLGTEWRDTLQTDMWLKMALSRSEAELDRGRSVVIDDMRFPHEFDVLAAHPLVTTVHVTRRSSRRTNSHPSEGLLDGMPFDFTIPNEGTLDELHSKADQILSWL